MRSWRAVLAGWILLAASVSGQQAITASGFGITVAIQPPVTTPNGRWSYQVTVTDARSKRETKAELISSGASVELVRVFDRAKFLVITVVDWQQREIAIVDGPSGTTVQLLKGTGVQVSPDGRFLRYNDAQSLETVTFDVKTLTQGQVMSPEDGVVKIFSSGSQGDRIRAADVVLADESLRRSYRVRESVIEEFRRIAGQKSAAGRPGDDKNFASYQDKMIAIVATYVDKATIPSLLASGRPSAAIALGEFGSPAVIAIEGLWRTNRSAYSHAFLAGTLEALSRCWGGTLSPEERNVVRNVIREALARPGQANVLRSAMATAALIGDVEFRQFLQQVASDRDALTSRGIDDPADILALQARARDLLLVRV